MTPGPYIVTTKRRSPAQTIERDANPYDVLSRVAVATLEEAQGEVESMIRPRFNAGEIDIPQMPDTGERFSLPDGTVIEVERTTWLELVDAAGLGGERWVYRAAISAEDSPERRAAWQRIIDAFNAQEANR